MQTLVALKQTVADRFPFLHHSLKRFGKRSKSPRHNTAELVSDGRAMTVLDTAEFCSDTYRHILPFALLKIVLCEVFDKQILGLRENGTEPVAVDLWKV